MNRCAAIRNILKQSPRRKTTIAGVQNDIEPTAFRDTNLRLKTPECFEVEKECAAFADVLTNGNIISKGSGNKEPIVGKVTN
jgi:hypothetical protein